MNLTDGLAEHLQRLTPPPPDLDLVVRAGRRRRRARLTAQAVAAVLVVGVLGGTTALLRGGGGGDTVGEPPIAVGPLDFSHGLRAYGDPGRALVLGGRKLPADDLAYLDTDAAAAPQGVVFFRAGRPILLGRDGTADALWDAPVDDPKGWHPTAKVDADGRHVAFAVTHDGAVTLVVRDLASTAQVSVPVRCGGQDGCRLVVDGIDHGTVFVRQPDGTHLWRYAADEGDRLEPFAGPTTRVADVRNRTVLYDGPRPTVTLPGWTYVAGAIDSQLTFDGRNILAWSPVLKSIANGEAFTLDLPSDARFFTFDTDGSVLAATTGDPARFFDCEVPSGVCKPIGTLRMTGGDPMFIGNDM
jgi:hypothetical protein